MYKHIIKTMGDVNWMALIPLVLFVVVFLGVSILWMRRSKKDIQPIAELPLNDGTI